MCGRDFPDETRLDVALRVVTLADRSTIPFCRAHNEYELHIWRAARYKLRKAFVKEYFNHFPISPPEHDWRDRHLLYSLVADLHPSTLFKRTNRFRDLVIRSMQELVEKFPNGYEGTAKRKDNE